MVLCIKDPVLGFRYGGGPEINPQVPSKNCGSTSSKRQKCFRNQKSLVYTHISAHFPSPAKEKKNHVNH